MKRKSTQGTNINTFKKINAKEEDFNWLDNFDLSHLSGVEEEVVACTAVSRPPLSYTEIIQQAILEKGPLTLPEIHQWIWDHFPFYKAENNSWKNSIRHSLTVSPRFCKGKKAPHRGGHLWTIANDHYNFHKKEVQMSTQSISQGISKDTEQGQLTATQEESKRLTNSVSPTEEELSELNLDEINNFVAMSDEKLLYVLFPELNNI